MNQEITCPKCSYKFALDQALNREIELQVRTELSDEFKKKEAELRRQLAKEANDKAERNSAELQAKVEAQARELKETRNNERTLLRKTAELEEQAEKAELEAQRRLAAERETIRKAAQDQILEEHRLKDAEKNKQLDDMRRQIEDLKRKAEQGSQKLQGDVQELELERCLKVTRCLGRLPHPRQEASILTMDVRCPVVAWVGERQRLAISGIGLRKAAGLPEL